MKKHTTFTQSINYIETPRKLNKTVKLDTVLEQRMKDFMLSRRRIRWIKFGM